LPREDLSILLGVAIANFKSFGGITAFILPFILWVIGIADVSKIAKRKNIQLSHFMKEGGDEDKVNFI